MLKTNLIMIIVVALLVLTNCFALTLPIRALWMAVSVILIGDIISKIPKHAKRDTDE